MPAARTPCAVSTRAFRPEGLPGRRCRQAHRERLLAIAQALATGQTRTNKNK
jgi:hypothetical protein